MCSVPEAPSAWDAESGSWDKVCCIFVLYICVVCLFSICIICIVVILFTPGTKFVL